MIKLKLKNLGITLADFAQRLEISRPTLDTYIEMYERKEKIPKDKYQNIFECLFENEISSKDDFLALLDHCHELIERDKALGTLDLEAKKTDVITSVIDEMKKDMYTTDADESIYIFINMVIRSYKKEPIFKDLARYFLILNGKYDIESVSEIDKVYLSNYFKLFNQQKNGELKFSPNYYELFINRIKEIKEMEEGNKKRLEKLLIDKVNSKIQSLLKLGIDIDDIDINELINDISFDDGEN